MRKRNWREYNKQLVQRGSLTFLIDPKWLKNQGKAQRRKKLGRPLRVYRPSDYGHADGQDALPPSLPRP